MTEPERLVFLFFTGIGVLLSGLVVLSEVLSILGVVKKDEDE